MLHEACSGSSHYISVIKPSHRLPVHLQKPLWQHNPDAEGAVVLNKAQWTQAGDKNGVTPVVVDPHIARKLRPHQQQGVQFLYECVMGLREANRQAQCCNIEQNRQ